jgi:FdhE protein
VSALEALDALKTRDAEWAPWLAVVRVALAEVGGPAWNDMVPHVPQRQTGVPLLAGAVLNPDMHALSGLFEKLKRSASDCGSPLLAGVGTLRRSGTDAATLFEAVLNRDTERIAALASDGGCDADALHALAGLLPLPFLQACSAHWGIGASARWGEGYCPVCAEWPAFAEVRGVERSRHLRCGHCGSAWEVAPLWCFRCRTKDHDALGSLVVEQPGSSAVIEVCKACRAYVKVFTTLQGCAPAQVMVEDLASVELDLAAAAREYERPHGAAYALGVTLGTGAA